MRTVQGVLRADDTDVAKFTGSKKCIGRRKTLKSSLGFLTDNFDAFGNRVSTGDDGVAICHLCRNRRIRPRTRTTATKDKREDGHGFIKSGKGQAGRI